MCTVSLRLVGAAVELVMNRDERHSRSRESAAVVHRQPSGVLSIRPLDPDGGGTWVGVNEYGLMAALLNDYTSKAPIPEDRLSRGAIVEGLLGLTDAAAWRTHIAELPLQRYPPFTLVTWAGSDAQVHRWTGSWSMENVPTELPIVLTSSSWNPVEVEAWRLAQAATLPTAMDAEGETIPALHLIHDPDRGAWGTLMRRPDARTRSITCLRVDPSRAEVRCRYYAEPLDGLDAVELRLPLRAPCLGGAPV